MTGNVSPDDRILTDTTRKGSNMYIHACMLIIMYSVYKTQGLFQKK